METIFKYILEVTDKQTIKTFKVFKSLSVQVQDGELCLWALVDTNASERNKNIYVVGTGHPADSNKKYIGTVQKGGFVWHVFEDLI